MPNSARDRIAEAAHRLAADAAELHETLSRTPASPYSGEGYAETVELIGGALDDAGLDAERIEVPQAFLDHHLGPDLEKAAEYLPVTAPAPRVILTSRLPGRTPGNGLHLTHNYDLWRGVQHERAGTVVQIMALRALRESGVRLAQDVFFSSTPDQHLGAETGHGYLAEAGIGRAPVVITGSMGGLDTITVGYKGKLWAEVTVRGRVAHGSAPQLGINAIDEMMIVMRHLNALNEQYAEMRTQWPVVPDELNAPTLAVCRIEANVDGILIPEVCSIHVDRRLGPDESLEEVERELRGVLDAASREMRGTVELEVLRGVESVGTPFDCHAASALSANIKNVAGEEARPAIWPNYTGFRYFPELWGAETVGYSPGRPGLGDEAFDPEELAVAVEILATTVYDLVGADD